jgi:tetratricopeptide (TPR) repeat protein
MRLLSKTVVVLFCAWGAVLGQGSEQAFQRGNALYQQGKFAEAVSVYEEIIKSGLVSGELLFNLGNAYHKTGKMGKAILQYERALRLMPGDDDLRHNLQLGNLLIVDKIEATPRLFLWDWWDGIKAALSLRASTWVTYAAFLLLVVSIAIVVLARSFAIRKAGVIAVVCTAMMFIFLLSVLVGRAIDAGRTDEAVVIAAITTIKNSPDPTSSDAFVLHAGVKVRITDSVNSWIKIRLADGKVGWMEKSAAEVI